MRDKQGNKLTTKEFFKRWGEGIKKVTPLQQTKISFIGSWFVIVGVLIGLVTTLLLKTWWLFIILLGSLLITGISLLGMWQKYSALKIIDIELKKLEVTNNE